MASSGSSVGSEGIVAIVLGASEWPLSPGLPASRAFQESASDFLAYLRDPQPKGLGLLQRNILDLFDKKESADRSDRRIGEFLLKRLSNAPVTDVILFYTGHGGFTEPDRRYFMALRGTRSENTGASGYRMASLVRTLNARAPASRRILILDSCFAAAAIGDTIPLSDNLDAMREQTLGNSPEETQREPEKETETDPQTGTALICAASATEQAKIIQGERLTMFSGALLDTLRDGDRRLGERLSLAEIGRLTSVRIQSKYADRAISPQLHYPEQGTASLAGLRIFPNPARIGSSSTRRRRSTGYSSRERETRRPEDQESPPHADHLARLRPYLVDRHVQNGRILASVEASLDKAGTCSPVTFFVHGRISQCVDNFVDCVVLHTIPELLNQRGPRSRVVEYTLTWQSDAEDDERQSDLEERWGRLRASLRNGLGIRSPKARRQGDEDEIVARLKSEAAPIILTLELPIYEWRERDRQLLDRLISWWHSIKDVPRERPFVLLVYSPYGDSFADRLIGRWKLRQVQPLFIEGKDGNTSSRIARMPPLGSVSLPEVMSWAKEHRKYLLNDNLGELRRDLRPKFRSPIGIGTRRLVMERVAELLKERLRSPGNNGSQS
jgi:hypothetical protein